MRLLHRCGSHVYVSTGEYIAIEEWSKVIPLRLSTINMWYNSLPLLDLRIWETFQSFANPWPQLCCLQLSILRKRERAWCLGCSNDIHRVQISLAALVGMCPLHCKGQKIGVGSPGCGGCGFEKVILMNLHLMISAIAIAK